MADKPTLAYVRNAFACDTETGVFTRRSSGKQFLPGKARYISIEIAGKMYSAHRLAWFYVNGEWPDGEIDHINLDKKDNRIGNLRLATRSQNAANCRLRATNKCGFKGVSKQRNKWAAFVHHNRKNTYLGVFETPEAAHSAYLAASKKLHGQFVRS